MAVVIDASIAAAWCFPDEQAQAAEHVLDILRRSRRKRELASLANIRF